MSGTAAAQVIGLLILPVLSRKFTPEAFGVFQLYLSLLVFSTVGIALRIELTLLSKPERETQATLSSLFLLVIAVGLIITAVLTVYDLLSPGLGFPAVFFGLGLIGNGFAQVSSYKLIRDQRFSRLAIVKVLQVVIYAAFAFVIAITRPTLWGIIAADVAGRMVAGAVACYFVRKSETRIMFTNPITNLLSFVRRNWELVVISLPGALANSAGAMLSPFMIFQVFGAAAAGQFGLVDRSMGVPVAMLVNAGSQVYVGRVTALLREQRHKEALSMFIKLVSVGGVIGGIGAGATYLLLPAAFGFVFGPGWETAISIARIMVFVYAVTLVVGVVNQTLVALAAYRLQSAWDICWPLSMSAVWIAVEAFDLDLRFAITLHAMTVGGLGLAFIGLCIIRLRSSDQSAHLKVV